MPELSELQQKLGLVSDRDAWLRIMASRILDEIEVVRQIRREPR